MRYLLALLLVGIGVIVFLKEDVAEPVGPPPAQVEENVEDAELEAPAVEEPRELAQETPVVEEVATPEETAKPKKPAKPPYVLHVRDAETKIELAQVEVIQKGANFVFEAHPSDFSIFHTLPVIWASTSVAIPHLLVMSRA